jgi:sugar lactone lactonase YvrE
MHLIRRNAAVCALLCIAWAGARAQVLTKPVGVTSAVQTARVTVMTAGTLGPISVLTQGSPNLDFNFVSGGTCVVGTAYNAGQTCTVNYTFRPTHPGLRYGGISLSTSGSVVLGNAYIYGLGTGPQVIYSPAAQSLVGGYYSFPTGVAVDAAGDVFLSDENGNSVSEVPASTGVSRQIGPSFIAPDDVAVDGVGNVFVIYNRTSLAEIQAVNGIITTSSLTNVISTNFAGLDGMKVDGNGNIYLASSVGGSTGGTIQEVPAVNGSIPANPTVLTLVSGAYSPTGVAIDASGNVYFSDETGNAAWEAMAVNGVIPANPTVVALATNLNIPTNIALDAAGNVFVSEDGAIAEIEAMSGVIPANPTVVQLGTNLKFPQGLAVDGSGNIFIADQGFSTAVKLDFADAPTLTFATTAVGSTSADSPQTVSLGNDGNTNLSWSSLATTTNPYITTGFTFTSTCPVIGMFTTLAYAVVPGGSCAESISFKPVAAGPDSGKFTLTDNNLNGILAQQYIYLNGTGIDPDFSLTANPPTITIETQHHGTMQLTLTSIGMFAGPVVLGCQGPLPPYVTCELPSSETLTSGSIVNFNFTMDTDAVLNFLAKSSPAEKSPWSKAPARMVLGLLLPLMLAGFARRRRFVRGLLLIAALAVGATGLTACGNKWPAHTPPGTYTIPVVGTGTASTGQVITHTLNITLTVTP